jgi:hypothetical protein
VRRIRISPKWVRLTEEQVTNPLKFGPNTRSVGLLFETQVSVYVRDLATEERFFVTDAVGEIVLEPVGFQDGFEITVHQLDDLTSGEVWIDSRTYDQTVVPVHGDMFVRDDHRPKMSPEMRAIARLAKQNEIQRERDRRESAELLANERRRYEQLLHQRGQEGAGAASEASTGGRTGHDQTKGGDDGQGGGRKAGKPKTGKKPGGAVPASEGTGEAGARGGREDDTGGHEAEHSADTQ